MSNLMVKCKNCGASMQVDMQAKTVTCLHCGTTFLLSEFLDENDLNMVGETNVDLDKKMKFNEAIKQGETYLFQAEYIKAEEAFKLALSIDSKNFKAYLGIVKAKTKNLNILPQNEDYKNYAKKALDLAGPDDYYQVKSTLEKLELLKQENAKIRLSEQKKRDQRHALEENRRIKANFFSKLAYVLVGLIACALLVGIVVTMIIKDGENKTKSSTIEISTAAQFKDFVKDEDALGSNITVTLKNDIDLNGAEISPIGAGKSFKGTFRGNGYKLKNFSVKNNPSVINSRIGLFETIEGAKISGLILDNVTFKVDKSSTLNSITFGFIAGHSKNSTISLCGVENSCSVEIIDSNKILVFGGLVGSAETSKINNSYSNASIIVDETYNLKTNHYFGGICGYLNDSTILNCLYAGSLDISLEGSNTTTIYVGAIAGFYQFVSNASSISNSAFAGSIKCVSQKPICKIAAVTNYAANAEVDINRVYANFVLTTNFENIDGQIELEELINYSTTERFFIPCSSLAEFKEKIDSVFDSRLWNKTNDIPTLQNKITGENTSDFSLT